MRSRRLIEAVNVAAITALRALVEDVHHITTENICTELIEKHHINISHGNIYSIVHDVSLFRKVCAGWVLRSLSEEHRKNRMGATLELLTSYKQEGEGFLSHIVMGDESWVHFYTLKTSR